jgi:hypothetical protein
MKDTLHERLIAILPEFEELIGNTGLIPNSCRPVLRFSEEYLFELFRKNSSSLAFWKDIADFIKRVETTGGYTKFCIQDFCLDRLYNEAEDKYPLQRCE